MKFNEIGNKIWIVGPPGAGKSTLARYISGILNIPHYELDSFFWSENWTKANNIDFRNNVKQCTEQSRWVIDGQYSHIKDIIINEVDTFIWLDLKFSQALYRVIKRTLSRLITQEELWNGNRENVINALGLIKYTIQVYPEVVDTNKKLLNSIQSKSKQVTIFHIKSKKDLKKFTELIRNTNSLTVQSERISMRNY
ncbi:AAA family ATPase [Bacillus toyonensis]|uniref:AAA family ATPase n=1 Tax=Bacillus toyonensis TaxID=155322 RepID=UPI000BED8A46|nr:AAA family ATPase [Bacillus toyonensis]PEC08073.1 hypothetical protein CON55_26005 [Bacillus toyonensis]